MNEATTAFVIGATDAARSRHGLRCSTAAGESGSGSRSDDRQRFPGRTR
ncbi:hypothetical protein GLA29479_149 [Lysobacter antibioticus]|nr:hypothetical protein GLA29479_149 [Lysobacter antibioticus]